MKTQNLWYLTIGPREDHLRTVTICFKNFFYASKFAIQKRRGKMLFLSPHTVFMKNTSFRKNGFSPAKWNRFLEFKSLFVTFFFGENNDCIYSLWELNSDTFILDRKSLTFSVTDCFLPNLSRTLWNSIEYLWKSVIFWNSESK